MNSVKLGYKINKQKSEFQYTRSKLSEREIKKMILCTIASKQIMIFPTKGSNQGLLHCRQILYHLTHHGSP